MKTGALSAKEGGPIVRDNYKACSTITFRSLSHQLTHELCDNTHTHTHTVRHRISWFHPGLRDCFIRVILGPRVLGKNPEQITPECVRAPNAVMLYHARKDKARTRFLLYNSQNSGVWSSCDQHVIHGYVHISLLIRSTQGML